MLAYQAAHGFQANLQVPLVGLYATSDPGDLNALRMIATGAGSAYLGVDLALADQNAGTWDTDTPASAGDATPGSWGGHCLLAWDWTGIEDTDTVRLVTWGTFQAATWRWVRSRLTEVHGLFWRQLGDIPGLDYDRLAADA